MPSGLLRTSTQAATAGGRKDDTARRRTHFSLPAVAIRTTPGTTKSDVINEGKSES